MSAANGTEPVLDFALRMGDNALILGQRVSAWCGHAPILEEDIALANIGLDLIGQTKMWLTYAAELEGKNRTADELAFFTATADSFAIAFWWNSPMAIMGKPRCDNFYSTPGTCPCLTALKASSDDRISDIAEKSEKEAAYHLERSTDLVIRLGDGSQESHDRMQNALDQLWRFTGELTTPDEVDSAVIKAGIAPNFGDIKKTPMMIM